MTPSSQSARSGSGENGGDTLLRCTRCGHVRRDRFARCLSSGWPTHCDATMRIENTSADINAAVGEVLRPVQQSIALALDLMARGQHGAS